MNAPGRTDDDVRAAAQAVQLRLVTLAAVDRQDMKAGEMRRVTLKRFRDLNGEFARRHEHQRLRRGFPQVDS